ncbi:MAG: hypothetical protein V4440_06375 [Pseudomonadota bacterium]
MTTKDYGDVTVHDLIVTDNFTLDNLASDPSAPEGSLYANTTTHRLKYATGDDVFGAVAMSGESITIFTAPTAPFSFNGHQLTGLGSPLAGDNAISADYLTTYLANYFANNPRNFGCMTLTLPGSPISATGGTPYNLGSVGTFTDSPSLNFVGTTGNLVFGGSGSKRFLVTCVVSVRSDILSNLCSIELRLNTFNNSPIFTQMIVTPGVDTQITAQFILNAMTIGDVISVYGTLANDANFQVNELTMTAIAVN